MTDDALSPGRLALGARTALLDGGGADALTRLAGTRVLVVGAGGLGCPVIALLAGSGLGRLVIVDPDTIDATNLARQTLFTAADVGASKAERAAAHAAAVDPELEVQAVRATFSPDLVGDVDIVVDAADSTELTRRISDACAAAGIPFVWGSALGFDGQVSVFWDAHGIDFHDLHPEPLPDEGACALDGVLPALCHVVGAVMAAQVLALVAGIGVPLVGSVRTVDARSWEWMESPVRRRPDSERPRALAPDAAQDALPRVSVASVAADLQAGESLWILDVRTDAERALGTIAGAVSTAEFDLDAAAGSTVIVVCERGPRAEAWTRAHPEIDARVLTGGMRAWREAGLATVGPVQSPE